MGFVSEMPAWRRRQEARVIVDELVVRLRTGVEPIEPQRRQGRHPALGVEVDELTWFIW